MREPSPYVPNHLVWAIAVTIFCCLPAGMVAIVYAAQVNGMLDAGDLSRSAKGVPKREDLGDCLNGGGAVAGGVGGVVCLLDSHE